MQRVDSGLKGLDKVLEDRFASPPIILVPGETGCGKNTLSVQSLFYSVKNGETGLCVSPIPEPMDQMRFFTTNYSFYDEMLVKKVLRNT